MRQAIHVVTGEKGLSFIEVLIAMVILMVVSLALMQTALVGYQENLKNIMRDEAVSVAEEEMNELRNLAFTDNALLASTVTYTAIPRDFRSLTVSYVPTRTVADINVDSKQATIEVRWSVKGKEYKHSSTAIIRRQQ